MARRWLSFALKHAALKICQPSRYCESLRAARSGHRIPVWRDIPHLSRMALGPTQPPMGCVPCLSRGYSCRCVALSSHPHLPPWLWCRTLPLLSPLGLFNLLYSELALYLLIRHLCRIAKSDC
jgi:hypothetical protein